VNGGFPATPIWHYSTLVAYLHVALGRLFERRRSMFGGSLVDVAIGMIFVYLTISLICSGITEWIAHLTKARARYLNEWLASVLQDKLNPFTSHPLINNLSADNAQPSYITPQTFVVALLDTVAPVEGGRARTMADVRSAINSLSDNKLKKMLEALTSGVDDDLAQARQSMEFWFNDAMERLSGQYKRRARLVLFAIAIVVTLTLNINSVIVFDALYRDSAVRTAVVGAAQEATQQPTQIGSQDSLTRVQQIQEQLAGLNLPIGWLNPAAVVNWSNPLSIGSALLGWVITILAVVQGSPFWFDALNRLVNVRSTGARPLTSKAVETDTV
jgi:hypothetical protein